MKVDYVSSFPSTNHIYHMNNQYLQIATMVILLDIYKYVIFLSYVQLEFDFLIKHLETPELLPNFSQGHCLLTNINGVSLEHALWVHFRTVTICGFN